MKSPIPFAFVSSHANSHPTPSSSRKNRYASGVSCVTYPSPFLLGVLHVYLDDKDKTGCYYTFTKDYEINELRCFLPLP